MPSVPAKTAHDLTDFATFLERLDAEGFEFAVIGGMGVSAYARLMGEDLRSVDLDIYMTSQTLGELLRPARVSAFSSGPSRATSRPPSSRSTARRSTR